MVLRRTAREVRVLGALALALALVAGPAARAARADVRRLIIVHTNDLHGQLFPGPDYLTPGDPKPRMGGIAAVAAVVEAERARAEAEGAGFLALDAGDIFHGSPEGDASRGVAVVELMNLVGYDAVCLGNHEFAYGVDAFRALVKVAKFPFLAGNVWRTPRPGEGGAVPASEGAAPVEERLLSSWIFKETGGLRVAVVAVTHEATAKMNRPADTRGLRFEKAAAVLPELVAVARANADLVIALTHIGSAEDQQIAAAGLEGCPLIVGGHDHVALEPAPLVGDTLVVQAGEQGRRVGRVVLEWDTERKRAVRREASLLNLLPDAPRAPTVAAAAEERRRRDLDAPVGTAAREVRRAFSGESPAGGLAAEVLRGATGADLAIVNQTMIRGGFARGPVTRRDVYACVPFQNEVVTIELGGAALRELLERLLGRGGEAGLEVAGLTARYDPRRPSGERVLESAVGGAPIDPERRYRLATTDFYAEQAMARLPRKGAGTTPFEAMAEWFAKRSPVSPPEGRRLVSVAPAERAARRGASPAPVSATAVPAGERRP